MKLYDFRRCTCKLDGITCEEPYTADCVDCKAFKEYQKRINLIKIRNIGAKSPGKEERKVGKWEIIDEAEPRRYGCSNCKRMVWHIENFCPNCGARMTE